MAKKVHKGITGLSSHTSNFRTSRVIICFQWRFWVSFSESLICGRTAVSRRGAANTTELWKALKSAHALSKEVWHSAPDGNLREEKTRDSHWIQSINVMKSITEGEVCNCCTTGGGNKQTWTTLKKCKWCLPMQKGQTKIPVCCMQLLRRSGWLLGETHPKPTE